MPEIHMLLREYGDHLEQLAPAINVDELELVQVRPTRPVRWWHRPAIVVSAAAVVVFIVVGGLGFLFFGGSSQPADTTVASTIPPTVPTTRAEAAPEITVPLLSLPPPPALGDSVALHPDQELLAGVWIEAALTMGTTDILVRLDEPDTPGIYRSGDLLAFPTETDASNYLTNRVAEEMAPELEQPDSLGLGDVTESYRGFFGRGAQANVHLIRVETLVYVVWESNEGLDLEEISAVVDAMETDFSPSFSIFHGQVETVDTPVPAEQSISYLFESWPLPVGDGEGGDKATFSFGYERDGQGACTFWSGGVEPLDYVTYTPAGSFIDVSREFFVGDGWTTEETTVPTDNSAYLAAVEGCDRFPPLATDWGLGDLVATSTPNFDETYKVYQAGADEFVLVAPQAGYSDSDPAEFDQLALFNRPADVAVTELVGISVDGIGYVSIWVEMEGPRSSFEEMFGIDLSAMPNERIGVGFRFDSGKAVD